MCWVWSLTSFLFFICLVGQAGWCFRAPILSKAPETRPIHEKICAKLHCTVVKRVADDPVELVSREIRDHPQYRNTLLVNATLINRPEVAAEFPIIQLGFRGQTGQAMGVRRFEPHEYLDKSIDISAGMASNRCVYIALEVAGVDSSAVSFEFDFFVVKNQLSKYLYGRSLQSHLGSTVQRYRSAGNISDRTSTVTRMWLSSVPWPDRIKDSL